MISVIDISGEFKKFQDEFENTVSSNYILLKKDELLPSQFFRTFKKIRANGITKIYVHLKMIDTQFNMFYIKLICVLTMVKHIVFIDEALNKKRLNKFIFFVKDLPIFLLSCIYVFILCSFFSIILIYTQIRIKFDKGLSINYNINNKLFYIKTDFWFGLKAGGSVTHTSEFINAGIKSGFQIDVFSSDPLKHYDLTETVTHIEPSNLLFDFPAKISQIEYNLRFAWKVSRIIKKMEGGLIYQRSSNNNISGILLSMITKFPFVLEYNSSSKWIAKNWWSSKHSPLENICEKLNLLGCQKIAVVSKELKRSLAESGISESKILVNPNGVNPEKFRSVNNKFLSHRIAIPDHKRHIVGFIGMFGQWHGVITLSLSVKYVVEKLNDVQFLIIGDGLLKKDMVKILEKDGVFEHVSFIGVIPHNESPKYLNICEVLISPHEDMADGSKFFGSPTKIFEYMAMGKGIVASNVGQLSEILNKKNAVLVSQRDPIELANGIIKLISDNDLRERLGMQARRDVLESFTWEHNFMRIIDAIQEN